MRSTQRFCCHADCTARAGRVLNTSREKMSDKAVKSAVKRVDPMRSQTGMSREDVVERLLDAARRVTM